MGGFWVLSAMTFLPLLGAGLIVLVNAATGGQSTAEDQGRKALAAGLVVTVSTFLASLWVFANFDVTQPGYQMVEEASTGSPT